MTGPYASDIDTYGAKARKKFNYALRRDRVLSSLRALWRGLDTVGSSVWRAVAIIAALLRRSFVIIGSLCWYLLIGIVVKAITALGSVARYAAATQRPKPRFGNADAGNDVSRRRHHRQWGAVLAAMACLAVGLLLARLFWPSAGTRQDTGTQVLAALTIEHCKDSIIFGTTELTKDIDARLSADVRRELVEGIKSAQQLRITRGLRSRAANDYLYRTSDKQHNCTLRRRIADVSRLLVSIHANGQPNVVASQRLQELELNVLTSVSGNPPSPFLTDADIDALGILKTDAVNFLVKGPDRSMNGSDLALERFLEATAFLDFDSFRISPPPNDANAPQEFEIRRIFGEKGLDEGIRLAYTRAASGLRGIIIDTDR